MTANRPHPLTPSGRRGFPTALLDAPVQPRPRRRALRARAVLRGLAEKSATVAPHSAASTTGATMSARAGSVSILAVSAEAGGPAAIGSATTGVGSPGAAATAVTQSASTTTGPM